MRFDAPSKVSAAWSYKQSLWLRASTMLLLSLPLLVVMSRLATFLPMSLATAIENFVGAVGTSAGFIAFLGAIFSLSFFIASLAKKNPQFQFIVECFAGSALLLFMPTY